MNDKVFIFLAGLHRSGTSLLHEVMREHPEISGFSGTGVPQDEGQHLQSVYPTAKVYGGPGRFAFDERSYMTESHPLATPETAALIIEQWKKYLDLSSKYIIEKSPPNIIRTRFFQKLYPNSRFIAILRHPLTVSYATKKWSKTSIPSLLDHSLRAYETLFEDMKSLDSIYLLRYENFVFEPQKTIDEIFEYLGMQTVKVSHEIRTDINDKYFGMWEKDKKKLWNRLFRKLPDEFEQRANQFGYSINDYENLIEVPWLGAHGNTTS